MLKVPQIKCLVFFYTWVLSVRHTGLTDRDGAWRSVTLFLVSSRAFDWYAESTRNKMFGFFSILWLYSIFYFFRLWLIFRVIIHGVSWIEFPIEFRLYFSNILEFFFDILLWEWLGMFCSQFFTLRAFCSQTNSFSNFLLLKFFSLTKIYSQIYCSQTNLV